MRRWAAVERPGGRALVLGGGGATGIAWEAGVLVGLADHGVDLRTADTMVGTSAGSVVAAHARSGTDFDDAFERLFSGEHVVPPGRIRGVDAVRFLVAQSVPHRRLGRAVLGRAGVRARTAPEEEWVAAIGERLTGAEFPDGLLITAVDARTGASVVFDKDSGVPLERAMAASCAVPGVYPAVEINGRRYVDGGVRTVTNADLAAGHERVVVIAPIAWSLRRTDRPHGLLGRLGADVRSTVVVPSRHSLRAMGRDVLDVRRARGAAEAGRADAARVVDRVREVWE
jgi:NTE family protein